MAKGSDFDPELLVSHKFPELPGLQFDPRLLLHGQQYIEIYKPFPSSACLQNKASVSGLYDKGKAAILEIETKSYKESGELLCMNRMTAFLRGAGGFSKSSSSIYTGLHILHFSC